MGSISAGAHEVERPGGGYRWVMLSGLWMGYCSFGLVQGGIPPLIGPVSQDLGLSRSAMGSVLGAWTLVYIAVSIPAGALIDRFGLKRSLAVGVLLIALSGVLRAVAVNYATLFLAVAVFGLGGPFVSIGAPKLVSTWFSKQSRGTAMGIYMTASACGRIVALSTANSLLMPLYGASWRLTLVTFAGVALLSAVAWWAIAREPEGPVAADGHGKDLASSLKVFPELLQIRVVQVVLVVSVGSFLFNHALNNWLPEILQERGMSAAAAGIWATLPIVVGIVASLVIPHMARPSIRVPMLVGIFLVASASALIIGLTSGAWLAWGLVLQGAASRAVMPILMLVLMDAPQIGPQRMGAVAGLYFTAGEVGGVLGPLVLGVVADLTSGFLGGMLLLAGVSFALAFLSAGLGLFGRGLKAGRPGLQP